MVLGRNLPRTPQLSNLKSNQDTGSVRRGHLWDRQAIILRRLGPAVVFESGVGREDRWMPPVAFLEAMGYRLHRPEISGEGILFQPFAASGRAGMEKYFNVVATRGV
jgi:hypothetical protein